MTRSKGNKTLNKKKATMFESRSKSALHLQFSTRVEAFPPNLNGCGRMQYEEDKNLPGSEPLQKPPQENARSTFFSFAQ
jgi:hypothetical protein